VFDHEIQVEALFTQLRRRRRRRLKVTHWRKCNNLW